MHGIFIAYSDRIVVSVTLTLCLGWVYQTYTNPETRAEISLHDVNRAFATINEAYVRPGHPNFSATKDFATALERRFAMAPSHPSLMAWLSAHPSVLEAVPPTEEPPQQYIFVPRQPLLSVETAVGELRLHAYQQPLPTSLTELAHGPHAEWIRDSGRSTDVVNSAQEVGIWVEYRTDTTGWQPMEFDHGLGLLPLSAAGTTSGVSTQLAPWTNYELRAQTVVVATTPAPGQRATLGQEVVVVNRTPHAIANDRNKLREFTHHHTAAPLPNANQLELPPNSHAVLGPVSAISSVTIPAPVAMGLMTTREHQARLVLKKFERDHNGHALGWSYDQIYHLQLDDPVGKPETTIPVPWSPHLLNVDFSTPFVLDRIIPDQQRVWYWEVELRSQMIGNQAVRSLVVEPKTKQVDIVQLRHRETDSVTELVAFQRIPAPRWNQQRFPQNIAPTYPLIPSTGLNEGQQFTATPDEYLNPALEPEAPQLHHDQQKLATHINPRLAEVAAMSWVEMPDGRIYAYLPANNQVMMAVIHGSAFDRQQQAAQAPKPQPVD